MRPPCSIPTLSARWRSSRCSMVGTGLAGGFGHYLLIAAHRLAPAAVLSPLIYTEIVWVTALGFVVFGDLPTRWTLTGAAIVIASGLYILHRERTVRRSK